MITLSEPLIKIESLLMSLPRKDVKYGYKFLAKRDFESLKELVDSSIIKTINNITSENPKKEYLEVNLDELRKLKVYVDEYAVPYLEGDNDKYSIIDINDDDYENDVYY